MIEIEENFAQASRTYMALRDGIQRDLYRINEMNAQYIARQLAEASPIGNYDDEPGHQPVPRKPGELAGSWHAVPINQYTVAVETTVWYGKLLVLDVEKESWRIIRQAGGSAGRGGPGNQRGDILRQFSGKGDLLKFRGWQDGSVMLLAEVERHKQDLNPEMVAVIESASMTVGANSRTLFGQAIQDYLRVR